MTYTNGAVRAACARRVLELSPADLDAATFYSGQANSPDLKCTTIDGMGFFLGVDVDPTGLRPLKVRLVIALVEGQEYFVLIEVEDRRPIVISDTGPKEIAEWLKSHLIHVDLEEEAYDVV